MSMILRSSKIVSLLMIFVLVSGCSWFGGKKSSSQGRRDNPVIRGSAGTDPTPDKRCHGDPGGDSRTGEIWLTSGESTSRGGQYGLITGHAWCKVKQEGGIRWAELESRPEVIWQESQGFFRSLGFEISYEDAKLGMMQTNWLSNRAYSNVGFWKSLFGAVVVTGLRDRYRVRLERTDNPNITRMYLVHQGLLEDVIEDDAGENINRVWRWRPNDPELEAEVLKRFLVFRGMDEKQAEQVVKPKPRVERAVLQDVSNGQIVVVNDNFARTWRRVGVAIDRLGLIVTDRNRSEGIYYLQLSDDFVELHNKEDSGLMKKWFGGDDDKKSSATYVMKLEERGETTTVSLHDQNGQLDNSATAKKLNKLLYQQLH